MPQFFVVTPFSAPKSNARFEEISSRAFPDISWLIPTPILSIKTFLRISATKVKNQGSAKKNIHIYMTKKDKTISSDAAMKNGPRSLPNEAAVTNPYAVL